MNMTSTIADSATLAKVEAAGDQRPEEWISPIGQSITESIEEDERLDPEYKAERERNRPRRELARVLMLRRIELDLSQQELADRMGTSVAVISRLEKGEPELLAGDLETPRPGPGYAARLHLRAHRSRGSRVRRKSRCRPLIFIAL